MPIVKCKICFKEFYGKPFFLKRGQAKYCSPDCMHIASKTGEIVKCFICEKETYKTIKELRVSKSKKYFCSKSCQTKWRNTEFVGEKHGNWKGGESTYRDILKKNKISEICQMCSNDDSRVLAVHHIDKNHKNNKIENLVWLCHNCHHLVHHYKEVIKNMEVLV